jgi:hypothetical protein
VRILSILIVLIIVFTGCNNRDSYQEGWEKRVQSNPIIIGNVGEPPSISVSGVIFTPILFSELIEGKGDRYDSLWVNNSEQYNFISTQGVSFVESYLKKGKVIVFIGNTIPNEIRSLVNPKGMEKTTETNMNQNGFYLWMENDQIKMGIVGTTKNTKEKVILKRLLEQTVNHLNY